MRYGQIKLGKFTVRNYTVQTKQRRRRKERRCREWPRSKVTTNSFVGSSLVVVARGLAVGVRQALSTHDSSNVFSLTGSVRFPFLGGSFLLDTSSSSSDEDELSGTMKSSTLRLRRILPRTLLSFSFLVLLYTATSSKFKTSI